jgi:peroxiredoxin
VNFGFSSTYIALWVFVAFQGLLIVALLLKLESLRQLVERGASIPIGSRAPGFTGVDQFDKQTGLETFDGRAGIVLFVAPECSLCKALLTSIESQGHKSLPHTIMVCRGEKDPCWGVATRLSRTIPLIIDQSGEIAAAYGASTFPRAIVLDGEKKIRGYSYPKNIDDLRQAFEDSLEREAVVPVGELSLTQPSST